MSEKDNGELFVEHESGNTQQEKTTTAYIYKAPYMKRTKKFMEENGHTLVYLNANVNEDWNVNNGNKIEILIDAEVVESIIKRNQSEKYKYNAIRTQFFTSDFKSKNSKNTYWITLNEPFSKVKYDNGQQTIFKISSLTPSLLAEEDTLGLINPEGAAEGILENVEALTEDFDNASIDFTITDHIKDISEFTLGTSKYFGLQTLEVFGKDKQGIEIPQEIKSTSKTLTPLLVNIVDTQDKLTIYIPWFDHDFSPKLALIKEFNRGRAINDVPTFKKSQHILKYLLDILMTSYAFADEFSFVQYVTDGNSAGKIKGDQFIGYQPKQASALVNKTAIAINDSRYERFLREYPQTEVTSDIRTIKQMTAALSRFLSSSQAIAKGKNNFHTIYLPFYLDLINSMQVESIQTRSPLPGQAANVTSYVLPENLQLIARSKYFNFAQNGTITNANIQTFSQSKTLQLDSKITIPTPQDIYQPINKLPHPRDIDPTRSDDISFLTYFHIKPDELNKLFSSEDRFDINLPAGTEITSPIPTATIDNGKFYQKDRDEEKVFKELNYDGEFISGVIETIDVKKTFQVTVNRKISYGTTTATISSPGLMSNVKLDSDTRQGIINKFMDNFGTDPKTHGQTRIIRTIAKSPTPSYGAASRPLVVTSWETFELETTVHTYRLAAGFKYRVSRAGILSQNTNDREAVFDKLNLKRMLDLFSPAPIGGDVIIPTTHTLTTPIDIDELVIRGMFQEKFTLDIKGSKYNFESFSIKNEKIAVDRIIFT